MKRLIVIIFLVSCQFVNGQNTWSSPYLDVQGPLYLRENVNSLNKAGNGWIQWATRNTSLTEVKIDLQNLNNGIFSGNVGIGSANPNSKLHVVGEGTFGSNGYGMMKVRNDDGTYLWVNAFTNDRTLRMNANQTLFDIGKDGHYEWYSAGVSRMFITPSGNVGIGTNTPA